MTAGRESLKEMVYNRDCCFGSVPLGASKDYLFL